MTPENFTSWLQGFVEISNAQFLGRKQTQILKDHLNLVFTKVTPDRNGIKSVDNPYIADTFEYKGEAVKPPATGTYCQGISGYYPQEAADYSFWDENHYMKSHTGHTGITAQALC
jgi:hypothetical protein